MNKYFLLVIIFFNGVSFCKSKNKQNKPASQVIPQGQAGRNKIEVWIPQEIDLKNLRVKIEMETASRVVPAVAQNLSAASSHDQCTNNEGPRPQPRPTIKHTAGGDVYKKQLFRIPETIKLFRTREASRLAGLAALTTVTMYVGLQYVNDYREYDDYLSAQWEESVITAKRWLGKTVHEVFPENSCNGERVPPLAS